MTSCPLTINIYFTKSSSLAEPMHVVTHSAGAQKSKDRTLCGLPASDFTHTAPWEIGANRPGTDEPSNPFYTGKGCGECHDRLAV